MKVNYNIDEDEGYEFIYPLESLERFRTILETEGWRWDEKNYRFKRPKQYISDRDIRLNEMRVNYNRLHNAVQFIQKQIENRPVAGCSVRISEDRQRVDFTMRTVVRDEKNASKYQAAFLRVYFSDRLYAFNYTDEDIMKCPMRTVSFLITWLIENPKLNFRVTIQDPNRG